VGGSLTVRDVERSRRFYEGYFGFGVGPATRYDDGMYWEKVADS
jgi:catechol 2,3-dioxygenase-like lactoylglutathione lyase family enzyme